MPALHRCSGRAPVPPRRSAFLHCCTGEPIPIPAPTATEKWYVVRLLADEARFDDEQLINLTIQRLRSGQYNIEDGPGSQWNGLRIAYRVFGNGGSNELDLAIAVAHNLREDVINGVVCIDMDFVFGERPYRPRIRYIDI